MSQAIYWHVHLPHSLPVNKGLPQIQAKRVANRGKNRCIESLPFDHNRVQLRRHCGMGDCQTDYINASYMDSYLRRRVYICAQSPFNAATASDFWSMVVQCNVAQIVLLDNQIEAGVVKCTKYWPDVSTLRWNRGHQEPKFLIIVTMFIKMSHISLVKVICISVLLVG